ncbi:hypothetical protein [Sphingorhabdus sp. 109]|uniref:hypothetical protein n=1 Tax=Sphingorhabdus sp. 109 TaxID=2653173 RepID=UPI0012F034B7|nr:hypothetical protein [Sphingorhabdus sp. 109]VWX61680.1 conserved hypothetical protein [Sphingorhabdus sp. 109]
MTDLSKKRLDRFVRIVAKTRRQISEHFFENLRIPAAPCLDILLALHTADSAALSENEISDYISCGPSVTQRFLDLMVSKGLVEKDDDKVRLTASGQDELSGVMEQFHADFIAKVL